jgi:hypothetical protein
LAAPRLRSRELLRPPSSPPCEALHPQQASAMQARLQQLSSPLAQRVPARTPQKAVAAVAAQQQRASLLQRWQRPARQVEQA